MYPRGSNGAGQAILDAKALASALSEIADPVASLAAYEQQRLEAFFRVYKQLPAKRKVVELNGFDNAAHAEGEVSAAIKAYAAKKK